MVDEEAGGLDTGGVRSCICTAHPLSCVRHRTLTLTPHLVSRQGYLSLEFGFTACECWAWRRSRGVLGTRRSARDSCCSQTAKQASSSRRALTAHAARSLLTLCHLRCSRRVICAARDGIALADATNCYLTPTKAGASFVDADGRRK